ncbi:MAG: HAMP domain-containing histidine kinase [Clostridiales bacterium]|jgi:signal transduction histidine kinase|nr:HAMP domain-containing histidine kinase [Clostridiales bacterium]
MIKKFRFKLLLFNMAITALVVFAGLSAIYAITSQRAHDDDLQTLFVTAVRFNTQPMNEGDDESKIPIVNDDGNPPDGELYIPTIALLVDKNGGVLYFQAPPALNVSAEDRALITREALERRDGGDVALQRSGPLLSGRIWQYNTLPAVWLPPGIRDDAEAVQITLIDVTASRQALHALLIMLLAVGGALLALIFLISFFFSGLAVRPISKMWEKQRRFVSDASHQLKTPLSIITANYNALMANPNETIQSQKEWMEYMKAGVDLMTSLVNDLLALARAEDKHGQIPFSSFDASETVARSAAIMKPLAAEKEVRLTLAVEPDIVVFGSRALFEQIFLILLENSLKYTEKKGRAAVTLEKTGRHVTLTVRNSGRGIPKQDLPSVFESFYRADSAREEQRDGHGLGLSIAKSCVDKLGGKITADSEEGGETVFIVTFPVSAVRRCRPSQR